MTLKLKPDNPEAGYVSHVGGVRVVFAAPGTGWGLMGAKVRDTTAAILLVYYSRQLWIAKANCAIWEGAHYAKTWAIDSAKAKAHG